MMKVLSSVLGLLALAGWVNPQCISYNDSLTLPGTPDLSSLTPFSVELFNILYPPGTRDNFFFSPFSIWNALSLAYLGANGNTEQELQQALQVTDKAYALATLKSTEQFYAERQAGSTDYTIDLANRVYVDQKFQLPECVRQVLHNEVENLNFREAVTAAANINKFVNSTTRGKIPTLVTADAVRDAVMVLVNAAYFKGLWLTPFSPNRTRKEDFYSSPDQPSPVDMMTITADFEIGESTELGATVLEMPYKGKAASMFVLLPHLTEDGSDPMDAMLSLLTPDRLRGAMANLRTNEVILKIPKFKLEETITDGLLKALRRLGIEDLFSGDSDLSTYDPLGGLTVGAVIHKAVVEVNEEGAEAAAATALFINRITSVIIDIPRYFTCDRPFLFFIHDNDTNNILFMGVYRQPQN